MKKTVILHVGAPRTGSTALQALATKYNHELRANGILYPVSHEEILEVSRLRDLDFISGNAGEFYTEIHRTAGDNKKAVEILVQLCADRLQRTADDKCSVVLLSSENLAHCSEDDLAVVKNVLMKLWPHDEVKVFPLLVVRDILDHAVSWWGHITRRHGYKTPREEFVSEHYRFEAPDVANRLSKTFGPDNLLVLRYMSPLGVLRVAAAQAGLKLAPNFGDNFVIPKINSTMSAQALSLLQQCNSLVPQDSWITNYEGDPVTNELFSDLGDFLSSADCNSPPDLLWFPPDIVGDLYKGITSKFAKELLEFNRRYRPIGGNLKIASRGPASSNEPVGSSLRELNGGYSFSMIAAMAKHLINSSDYAALRARVASATLLRDSGIFDQQFYMGQIAVYKDKIGIGQNLREDLALSHYRQFGWQHGLKPCAFFDPLWYLKRYPDLTNLDPTEHYVLCGSGEGRTPSPDVPEGFAARYKHAGSLASLLLGMTGAELRQRLATAA
jgi:hypothetical protein